MNWLEIKNLQSVSLKDIPRVHVDDLTGEIAGGVRGGKRLVQFFGNEEKDIVTLYVILADDNSSKLFVSSSNFDGNKSYRSITPLVSSAHLFERELYEQFGIKPEGHLWLKPVRKGIPGINSREEKYEFFGMSGQDVHEVGVGPIHAGVIEPGHFRFSCHGEKIYQLEIKLGFQHRGIEELFVRNNARQTYLLKLAESIAGDSVIGHSGAFASAVESLSNLDITRRAKQIRTSALELERIAVHLGDLSALSTDVGYLTGSSVFGALRTKIINTTMAFCGNRFGRGLITAGGINFDISTALADKIISTIDRLNDETTLAAEVLFSSASVLERFEKTGIVSKETAREIGMVGPAARASGLAVDVRSDHPSGGYEFFPVHKLTLNSGDVFARAYIRFIEIQQSIKIIKEQLENFTAGEIKKDVKQLDAEKFAVSLCEGWRGEIAYVLITGKDGKLSRVKIKDPSFHNWFALSLAVRNEGISDFPLCNKSFNLSYSGFDL